MVKVLGSDRFRVIEGGQEIDLSKESFRNSGINKELRLSECVGQAVAGLDQIQQLVLEMRYGLTGAALSVNEVASAVDAETDLIKEIEAQALRALYLPSKN